MTCYKEKTDVTRA